MSVLVPWDRKNTGKQRKSPVKTRPAPHWRKPVLYFIGLLFVVGVYWGLKNTCYRGVDLQNTDIVREDGELPVMCVKDSFLFLEDKRMFLWSGGRAVIEVPVEPAQAMVVDAGVVFMHENELHTVFSEAMPRVLRPVLSGEKFLPCSGQWPVLTCYPTGGEVIGESWTINATDSQGSITWQTELAFTPYLAKQLDGYIAVATYDLISGSNPYMAMLSAHKGEIYWIKKIPGGFWRDIFITREQAVVCVLDSLVYVLDKSGNMLWACEFEDSVATAAYDRGVLCVSHPVQEPWYQSLFRQSRVTAFNESGEISWTRRFSDSNVKVYNTGLPGETEFVVTGDGFVHILAGLDGTVVKRLNLDGTPVYYGNGVLLYVDGLILKSVTLVGPGDRWK